ncbi:MAG: ABC transporter permease [Treponema sp.]
MKELIWAKRQKLRRSKIVWITLFATVMTAVIVFAQGQFSFGESRYIEGAGWFMKTAQSLATFFVLPAVIALFGSYVICREEQEDTLKSLQLIPIRESAMTAAKLLITFVCSVLVYLLLFSITFAVEVLLHGSDLSVHLVLRCFKIYLLDGIGIFLAIAPIIAAVSRMKTSYWLALIVTILYSFAGLFTGMSGILMICYPITAVLTVSGYYTAPFGHTMLSLTVLLFCGTLSLLVLQRQ